VIILIIFLVVIEMVLNDNFLKIIFGVVVRIKVGIIKIKIRIIRLNKK